MKSGSKISDYLVVPFTWIGKASASLLNITVSKLINVEVGNDKKGELNLGVGVTTGFIIGALTGVGVAYYYSTGKNKIGRDKIGRDRIEGDKIGRDKISGDKVRGNKHIIQKMYGENSLTKAEHFFNLGLRFQALIATLKDDGESNIDIVYNGFYEGLIVFDIDCPSLKDILADRKKLELIIERLLYKHTGFLSDCFHLGILSVQMVVWLKNLSYNNVNQVKRNMLEVASKYGFTEIELDKLIKSCRDPKDANKFMDSMRALVIRHGADFDLNKLLSEEECTEQKISLPVSSLRRSSIHKIPSISSQTSRQPDSPRRTPSSSQR